MTAKTLSENIFKTEMKTMDNFISRGQLSRNYYMTIEEELYLVSNCCDRLMRPIFSEKVSPQGEQKLNQWDRIKKAQADQRLRYLYQGKKQYKADIAQLKKDTVRKGKVSKRALLELVK